MPELKTGVSKDNLPMHYSVGAIIMRNGKYLLVERKKIPYGFACPAGHVDEGEKPADSLVREIGEETGLQIKSYKLLCEEELDWNYCSRRIDTPYWYVYFAETEGETRLKKDEAKSIGWYTAADMKRIKLEQVLEYWLNKFGIIS